MLHIFGIILPVHSCKCKTILPLFFGKTGDNFFEMKCGQRWKLTDLQYYNHLCDIDIIFCVHFSYAGGFFLTG